ncbi:TetR/AcrR family transcriptional regulator [Actinomadura vinacea]|uniref:TetR/AcrR family transcriptional regulator n=1 Tax=Actinomadura vinacea TaxID=115336 RepID=A0ABN3K3L2_9ACTN
MDDLDLRTRNRLATRAAISAAALRLALENGPENVRVAQIAELAGVSPRTYNNHFSSREEAICAVAADRGEQVAAALRARPGDEPLHEALVAAVVEVYAAADPDRSIIRMIASNPSLRGEYLKAMAEIEPPLAAAIGERSGADELSAAVLAASAVGATAAATGYWLRLDDGTPYETVLREALRQIGLGADS